MPQSRYPRYTIKQGLLSNAWRFGVFVGSWNLIAYCGYKLLVSRNIPDDKKEAFYRLNTAEKFMALRRKTGDDAYTQITLKGFTGGVERKEVSRSDLLKLPESDAEKVNVEEIDTVEKIDNSTNKDNELVAKLDTIIIKDKESS